MADKPTRGNLGIAYTCWVTHCKPSQANAHPHYSDHTGIVHNGIIENHEPLREQIRSDGYEFIVETDTEVIAHLLNKRYYCYFQSRTRTHSYRSQQQPIGSEENFLASDQMALRQVTDRFVYLEEGNMVDPRRETYSIVSCTGESVQRSITKIPETDDVVGKGYYRHFMKKEIFEQARVIGNIFQGRIVQHKVLGQVFGTSSIEC